MATGKNKKYKAGQVKKGSKRKVIEPFSKKEWYNVKAPKIFKHRDVGQIVINKTAGTKIASEGLKGRVVEQSLADLMESEKYVNYNVKLRCEDVNNRDCLMVFHGMRLTNDKYRSLIKKWASLVEAHADVKTADGHLIRMFCIAMTSRKKGQIKKTSYAQQLQKKKIRNVMIKTMTQEAVSKDLNGLVEYLKDATLSRHIVSRCSRIFPLENVYVRKVKILKANKIDSLKLLDQHHDAEAPEETIPEDTGVAAEEAAQETA